MKRPHSRHMSSNFNPFHMRCVQTKTTELTPTNPYANRNHRSSRQGHKFNQTVSNMDEIFANETIKRRVHSASHHPRQKYPVPQTSNHEIGWFINDLVPRNKMWNHNIRIDRLTRYVEGYGRMTDKNIYKVRSRRPPME